MAEKAIAEAKAEADEAKSQLKQKDNDTARKMKAKGFSTEDIAKITGLTAEKSRRYKIDKPFHSLAAFLFFRAPLPLFSLSRF